MVVIKSRRLRAHLEYKRRDTESRKRRGRLLKALKEQVSFYFKTVYVVFCADTTIKIYGDQKQNS